MQEGAAYLNLETHAKGREKALVALGEAVAARPWNMDAIEQACQGIRDAVGDGKVADGLVLEACFTAAGFEMVTKIVDGTMRKPLPSIMLVTLRVVDTIGRSIRWIFDSIMLEQ